jgi:Phage tail tube protein, GTA-gp10
MKLTAFFGDGEKTFALPFDLMDQLERTTGTPIGLLCQRLPEGIFSRIEIVETIRLALIGGGMSTKEAKDFTDTYAVNRPFKETFPVAAAILHLVFNGEDQPAPDTQDDLRQAAASGDASAILRARIAEAYAMDDAE